MFAGRIWSGSNFDEQVCGPAGFFRPGFLFELWKTQKTRRLVSGGQVS
jgi:hypothetical protein